LPVAGGPASDVVADPVVSDDWDVEVVLPDEVLASAVHATVVGTRSSRLSAATVFRIFMFFSLFVGSSGRYDHGDGATVRLFACPSAGVWEREDERRL
jgi:hypothetical protein